MKAMLIGTGRMMVVAVALCGLVIGMASHASAQSSDVWYGPYDNGCYYYSSDGVNLTGYIYCPSGTGDWLGWYGPMSDGCFWDWEATGWTGAHICFVNGIEYLYPAPSTAPSTQVSTNADGSTTIFYPDGTWVTIPAYTGDCGDFCQTNIVPGGTADNGTTIWTTPRTQTPYTPGCEVVVEDYCYTTYPA